MEERPLLGRRFVATSFLKALSWRTRAPGQPPYHLDLDAARAQAAVTRLIDAYREFGHYLADLTPQAQAAAPDVELLEPAAFGLTEADLNRVFYNKLSDAGYSPSPS